MTSTTLHNAILVSEIMRTVDEPTDALELSNRSLFGAVTRELTHSPHWTNTEDAETLWRTITGMNTWARWSVYWKDEAATKFVEQFTAYDEHEETYSPPMMATTLLKAMPQTVSQKTALRWLEGKERSTWPKHDDEEAYQRCIGILEDIIEGQQQVIQSKETSRTDKEVEEKVKPFRAAVLAVGKDLKRWRSNPRDSMSWTTYVTVYLKSLFETLEETHFLYDSSTFDITPTDTNGSLRYRLDMVWRSIILTAIDNHTTLHDTMSKVTTKEARGTRLAKMINEDPGMRATNAAFKQQLRKNFENFQMGMAESVAAAYERLETMKRDPSALGVKKDDDSVTETILKSIILIFASDGMVRVTASNYQLEIDLGRNHEGYEDIKLRLTAFDMRSPRPQPMAKRQLETGARPMGRTQKKIRMGRDEYQKFMENLKEMTEKHQYDGAMKLLKEKGMAENGNSSRQILEAQKSRSGK